MIDVYNDPYCRRLNAGIKRVQFNKLKTTNSFKLWRTRQYKVQDGRCAYCKVLLSDKNIVTHIDHVTPLYFDGKNDFSNFVLSCRRCNMKKWIANNYVVPEWIKINDQKLRQQSRIKQLRKNQYYQLRELVDEHIADELSWIE